MTLKYIIFSVLCVDIGMDVSDMCWCGAMSKENRRLVTDELVEFEK